MIVLLNDSFILLLTVSIAGSLFRIFKFSLILSNITMVSLREYPTIVKKAAITDNDISYPSIEKIPRVIVTSCAIATIAPIAKVNSKRKEIYMRMPNSQELFFQDLFHFPLFQL